MAAFPNKPRGAMTGMRQLIMQGTNRRPRERPQKRTF
jgi:hypothetical protein